MSVRGTKRVSGVRGEEAGPSTGTSKRRRTEPEDALWQLRPVSDLKMASIYNRSASEAPAELFRKDLISAMKLPDSEPLTASDYWVITDTWKQEWERGVQVPVSPESLPAPKVKIIDNPLPPDFTEFRLYGPQQSCQTSVVSNGLHLASILRQRDWASFVDEPRPAPKHEHLDKLHVMYAGIDLLLLEVLKERKSLTVFHAFTGSGTVSSIHHLMERVREVRSKHGTYLEGFKPLQDGEITEANKLLQKFAITLYDRPREKYIHLIRDAQYQSDKHMLSSMPARAEATCSYDMDAADIAWLKLLNAERARAGASPITEDQFEKVIEELEVRTWDKIHAIVKSEEGLGIEYDENVICDVCRSPESEDGNEMVFCDSCNICVHQACYGITVIPDGQWLCRPCGDGVRPTCVLCPNLGGAMKCTPSGHKWAHVSCVLWIPEVSIGCAEKMEPITKISSIPASRWSLVCVLCRERKGACIQCSVKTCKTAYHVTCAFKHGLEMRAIIEDENADDGVKLRSYCQKHSVNSKREKCPGSGSEEEEVKRKRRKDMTSEEKTQARAARWHEIEAEFDRHVSVKDLSTHLLDVDQEGIIYIYNYWKLKRRSGFNRPLLPPKTDDSDLLSHRQEQADLDKMKMFVQLRQDLERVRNLCYMVSRREKLSRSFFRLREQTFHKQVAVLTDETTISGTELTAILEANHGPSIYDRLYSHPNAPDHAHDFDELLSMIAPPESDDEKKKDRNGLIKNKKSANPYKKHYVNGSRRSGSMYSGLSSEESAPEIIRSSRYRGRTLGSSTDDDVKKTNSSPKKKVSPKSKSKRSPKKNDRKKKVPQSKAIIDSSSDEDKINSRTKKDQSRSKTLEQLEKEMAAGKFGQSGTDTDDDLIQVKSSKNFKFPVDIYSDSSEDAKSKLDSDKNKLEKSVDKDSQQSLPRTKAAMKEFIPPPLEKKSSDKEVEKPAPKKRGRKPSNKDKKTSTKTNDSDDEARNKENIKYLKQKDNPTDLIVPQRQAAKKASENMRSTTGKKEEPVAEKQINNDDLKLKQKIKSKGKEAPPAKVGRKKPSEDIEKEPIAYVPQRQAAKKAAAHIKSGLGNKLPVVDANDPEKKKELDKAESFKTSPRKEDQKASKPLDSSSSSSNSSSSSYSSSSSSEDEIVEKPSIKPTAKAREIKPAIRQPSMFSPPGSRPTVDLPFLDKVSRPLSSTSASSDSESTKGSRDSESSSPTPKRPRRRRKGKSLSSDTSPRKAPDKKLKTSDREPDCEVPKSTPKGEEPGRPNDARAATRSRTRSTASIGNLSYKSDTRPRESSKDDNDLSIESDKTIKETFESSKLPTEKWKEDEDIKTVKPITQKVEVKIDTSIKNKCQRLSISVEDKEKLKVTKPDVSQKFLKNDNSQSHISPKMNSESKKQLHRRMSIKDANEVKSHISGTHPESPQRKHLNRDPITPNRRVSPVEKPMIDKDDFEDRNVLSPQVNDDFAHTDKHWLPKAPSPNIHPPPIEKPGGHEKYMTEDKSLDLDSTDKSSVRMIAKIQATLNENFMIRSPKTPMDARTLSADPVEIENPMIRAIRKRSNIEEKKFSAQDASHIQGVEISKSAKIPSTVGRSIFSPQAKDSELFEFDILNDSFNHDEMTRPFTYNELFSKEDTKEQGVQETRNLVDRLRMQLISKTLPTENSGQNETDQNDKDLKEESNIPLNSSLSPDHETTIPYQNSLSDYQMSLKEIHPVNHLPRSAAVKDFSKETPHQSKDNRPLSLTTEKWPDLSTTNSQFPAEDSVEQTKYGHYREDIKEPPTVQSDAHSVSEVGDTVSLSKQSDDSQPLSVVDHSVHSNDQDLTQDNQNYDNNNSLIHSDCATISSPYISHETSKWSESKIATRRSSTSSTNSEGSVCSAKTDLKSHMNSCDSHHSTVMPEIGSYPPMPAYSCAVEPSMPLNQYSNNYPSEGPAFLNALGSIPLFGAGAGACASSQLSLPSPGPGLYSPGLPFTPSPLIQPLLKAPLPTLCAAAFTSSSQNIALTTAMIAPPTPKPVESPREDIDVSGSDKMSIHVVSSPSVSADSCNEASNKTTTKTSNDSNEPMTSSFTEDRSSPKSLKSKFPVKSPGKSPGISPKQGESAKCTKRQNNRGNRSQRGRGRSKSRVQGHSFPPVENSIESKLKGTVYDFNNDELANDAVDLKALRDRRKSIDTRDDRKSEQSIKDKSLSPRVVSPHQAKRPISVSKEMKSPTPEPRDKPTSLPHKTERGSGFSQVQPVLPGPVDMRTYQSFENSAPPAGDAFHSHLLAFASGTADQQLPEIDEEIEKQLHTALALANKQEPEPQPSAAVTKTNELVKETFTPQLPKVSLSDSRNQLKVKIKGPFLDANYSTSSVQATAPQKPVPAHEPIGGMLISSNNSVASSMMTGSTNLRRMRKKELLRQYWTQDMNMDDPTNTPSVGTIPPPAAPPPLARAVITIPKAVASMTSIPTREDYKISETPAEKKKRKVTSGLSRELRHLEVSMNDEVEASEESKPSNFTNNASQACKRRGRMTTKPNKNTKSPITPKLKIKIGSNIIQQVNDEPTGYPYRPPKKRLTVAPAPKPSLEDLRRESMKYRRKVMADFEELEKTEKVKPKSEKRKKKKDKKTEKLQVINSESDSATKLIIKIKRAKEEVASESAGTVAACGLSSAAAAVPESPVDPFEYDPTAPDPLAIDPPSYGEASAMRKIRTAKVTPIRLKLARSSQGSGYDVMQGPSEDRVALSAPTNTPSLPLPAVKYSDVR